MSKLTAHSEFGAAAYQFIRELDVPAHLQIALTPLIMASLIRVHFRFWLAQNVEDAGFIPDPDAQFDHDPQWFQIDGWPEKGGSAEDVLARKWSERARLTMRWYGVHVWHVIDWLTVAEEADHAWRYRLDDDGYPVKLTKCSDLARLVAEATKGLRDRNEKIGGEIVLGPREEERVADLGVGYSLVQMHTPAALRREGYRMHNCLKSGDYGRNLIDQDFSYFSVRNPQDKPVATIEVERNDISQFFGPCNAKPADHLIDLVSPLAGLWQTLSNRAAGRFAADGPGPQNNDNRHVRRV
ncbi:hypothetical protein BJF92_13620 [Rhizobium rhizosphaerae]|uniref:Uncharacterized protein n=1 Tax=Xaviernesmea rhizosphaerae TaxID=1672749 RepID=A0A1Q9AHX9_9HYPH|nr:PcfJ domain-containing protein [Xaviernesmea rhizosphaerae]OLP54843.1 hypothetical protein BJF92_13620 [Xaviernesmea rhizosphaerae]